MNDNREEHQAPSRETAGAKPQVTPGLSAEEPRCHCGERVAALRSVYRVLDFALANQAYTPGIRFAMGVLDAELYRAGVKP